MAVLCSYLMSCFDGTLLRYFVSDFEMVTVAPIIIITTDTIAIAECTEIRSQSQTG
jgi:hypothetical protein